MPAAILNESHAPAELDWDNLGVKAHKVHGHIECIWSAKSGQWSTPVFVDGSSISVNCLAPGLNYGQQAYEGLKAVRGDDGQVRIFRLDQHAKRFQHSCEAVSLPILPESLFAECVEQAVISNAAFVPPVGSSAALYIRPLMFGSSGVLNVLPADEVTFCVMVSPINALHGLAAVDALIMEDFDRAAPRGVGTAKVGGNYAPMFKWARLAKQQGFGLTLHLDSQTRTFIDEFSTCAFIGVRRQAMGGFYIVIPTSGCAIQSVTSDSCVEIAKKMGWTVMRRPIPFTELASFHEVLAVGTASTIVPVRSITRFSTNDHTLYDQREDSAASILFHELQNMLRGTSAIGDWSTIVNL